MRVGRPTHNAPVSERVPSDSPPVDWRHLIPDPHLSSLLQALTGHSAVGWVLKSAPSLAYRQWGGALPMADPRLSQVRGADGAAGALAPGQTDADHFDPTQAAILRLADLRALRQGSPHTEVHRIETYSEDDAWTALDWRAWRLLVTPPEPEGSACLLVLWLDMGFAERADERLAQAYRQIQAQQMLIAQLRSQVPEESGLAASQASLAWAAQRFNEQLQREIDLSRREQRSFALILLALGSDGCADPITGCGGADHQEAQPGRAVEQAVGAILARQLSLGTRAMDTVAQIAPRRFGVILSGAQLTPAYARAEALRRQAAAQVAVEGATATPIELYLGVAAYPLTADQAGPLMAAAEAALREAQAGGSGRSVLARVPAGVPADAADAAQPQPLSARTSM